MLNSTFERLESAFEQQRRFTADAAHELNTPLAVIIAEMQAMLLRERTVSGLGLAICKAIVEEEGGTIQVTSTVSVGTTLEVRLPRG